MTQGAAVQLSPPQDLTGRSSKELGEHTYDFYRCERCTALVTEPQMIRGLANASKIDVCPCGGLQFRPTNPRPIEYLLPRVLVFALQRARALGARGLLANLRGTA